MSKLTIFIIFIFNILNICSCNCQLVNNIENKDCQNLTLYRYWFENINYKEIPEFFKLELYLLRKEIYQMSYQLCNKDEL